LIHPLLFSTDHQQHILSGFFLLDF
jgi:hypothetical protein